MPTPTPTPDNSRRTPSKDGLPVAKLLPPTAPKPPARPSGMNPAARPAGGKPAARPPQPADDPGFEVIEDPADPGFEVIEDTAPSRSARTRPVIESDFEVVEDDPPPRKKKPAVVDDDEDDERPRKKARSRDDDDEDEPRAKKRRRDEDEDDDDRPRKKKGKKKRKGGIAVSDDEDDREKESAVLEWVIPGFLTILGLAMAVIGAIKAGGALGVFPAIAITLGVTIILVPVTIAALMVIGMMVGIEYGTLGSAVRNLSAITTMVQGIMFLGMGLGLPCFIVYSVAPVITFGMFMTLFKLDMWETWITVTLLDAMQTGFSMLFFFVIIVAATSGIGRGGKGFDEDDGPPPGWNQKDNGGGNLPPPRGAAAVQQLQRRRVRPPAHPP